MKKVSIIFIVILLIILAITLKDSLSININPKSSSNVNNAVNPIQNSNNSLETKENTEGPVSVTVTPRNLEEGLTTWDFEMALDTHSQELNYDLTSLVELVDDQGKIYQPSAWEGDNPTGHHRKGVLKFNAVSPRPKSWELKISNVGGVAERSFKWIL